MDQWSELITTCRQLIEYLNSSENELIAARPVSGNLPGVRQQQAEHQVSMSHLCLWRGDDSSSLKLSFVLSFRWTCWHVEKSCAKVKYLIPVLKVFFPIFWSNSLASFADLKNGKLHESGFSCCEFDRVTDCKAKLAQKRRYYMSRPNNTIAGDVKQLRKV